MKRPRSLMIAPSFRRAFLRCFSRVRRSIAAGRRNRREMARPNYERATWVVTK
jgi:hypothetical protein